MVSPFAMHQQQLAQLAQQQALLMAAANASGTLKIPGNVQQGPNGSNIVDQSWPHVGYQFPGMMMPASGKTEFEKYLQVKCTNFKFLLKCCLYTLLKKLFFFACKLDGHCGSNTFSWKLSASFNIEVRTSCYMLFGDCVD